jgi:hypothetical protein
MRSTLLGIPVNVWFVGCEDFGRIVGPSFALAVILLGPARLHAQAGVPDETRLPYRRARPSTWDTNEANPSRPTVSTPATLTPVGCLQFENGVLYATDSPEFSKRLGVNQVTKLSINKRMEVLALFEPVTHSSGAAVSGNRPGEVFAGHAGSHSAGRRRAANDLWPVPEAALCQPGAGARPRHVRPERDDPVE